MPSGGYSLSITSLPYTVLWRPCACSHNLHYGEGRMLHSYSSDSSSTSQITEKDLLDGTTASEVLGESFLLTPPRFEFNKPHVDKSVPMDTTTPGPSKPAATPVRQLYTDPSPSTGAIRKRSHGDPMAQKGSSEDRTAKHLSWTSRSSSRWKVSPRSTWTNTPGSSVHRECRRRNSSKKKRSSYLDTTP